MLRVLHVLEALEGGTARHVVDVVRHVQGVEHHVAVPHARVGAPTDRLAAPAMAAAGATLHEVAMRRDPVRATNAVALARVLRLVRRVRPAMLHGHSSIGGLLARTAAPLGRLPVLYTPNGITDVRAGIAVERILGRVTTRFVAVSASERALAVRLALVDPQRLVVINNGIEVDPPTTAPTLDLRSALGLADGTPLVGSISRLVAQKRPEHLVAAWAVAAAARPDVHFVLIGAGAQQDLFDAAIDEHHLRGRVHQLKEVANASTVLDQLDVFTLASRFEGAPYGLLEAIRAGCPIAATDVVGTRDIIRHDATGLLAPFGDTAALGAHIATLLDDAAIADRLRAAARRHLADEFSVEKMGRRLRALYEELAER